VDCGFLHTSPDHPGGQIVSRRSQAGLIDISVRRARERGGGDQSRNWTCSPTPQFYSKLSVTSAGSGCGHRGRGRHHPHPEKYPVGDYVIMLDPWMARPTSMPTFPSAPFSPSIAGSHQRQSAPWRTACSLERTKWPTGYIVYGSSTMLVYTTGRRRQWLPPGSQRGGVLPVITVIRTPEVGRFTA